jgi:hypothetical protein
MKTLIAVVMLLVATPLIAQWKESPELGASVEAADSVIYTTSFAASLGYISSAETFKDARFYGGVVNVYQVIDEKTYLNFWTTLPGTNQEDQSFGLSFNRELAVPLKGLALDWNVGILALLPHDPFGKKWIGLPVGIRASYPIVGSIALYAIVDAVPAYNVNNVVPSTPDKLGLTFLGAVGLAVTP